MSNCWQKVALCPTGVNPTSNGRVTLCPKIAIVIEKVKLEKTKK